MHTVLKFRKKHLAGDNNTRNVQHISRPEVMEKKKNDLGSISKTRNKRGPGIKA